MKHGVLLASIGLIVGLSSGCAEDIVRSGSPVIEIAAYDNHRLVAGYSLG